MRRGRGWLIAGVLVIGVAAAAPLVMGQGIEGAVKGGVQGALEGPNSLMAQNGLGEFVRVSDYQYNKGAYTSSQSFKLSLGCTNSGQTPTEMTVKSTIQHGPFPGFSSLGLATVDTEVVMPPEIQSQLDKAFGGKKWNVRTVVGFDRSSTSTLTLPAGSVDESSAKLEWQQAGGEMRSSADGKAVSYTFSFPRAVVTPKTEPGGLTLENLRVEGRSSSVGSYKSLTNADQKGTLDRLSFDGGGQKFSLEGVSVQAGSAVTGDSGGVKYAVEARKGNFAGQDVSDVALRLGLDGLKVASLDKLLEGIRGLSGNVCQPAQTPTPAEYGLKLLPPALELVQGGMKLNLERLAFKLPEGETVLSGQADFADPGKVNLMTNPNSALEQLRARLKFSGSEKVLEKLGLAESAATFEQQGFVARSGDALSSELKFENQKLTVNGKEVPLGL